MTLDILGTPKYKNIIDVLITDLVWDGEEFVEHEGVAFSGFREVISWDGINGTPEHQVFCDEKAKSLGEALRAKTPILDCREPSAWEVETGRSRQRSRSLGKLRLPLRNKASLLLKDLKARKSNACGNCNVRPIFYFTELDRKSARAVNQWKVRCCLTTATNYKNYGGRGIEFRFDSILSAVEWVKNNIGYPPPGLSIDRIDNERHYEPGNLRWATRSEQMLNRRKWKCRPRVRH